MNNRILRYGLILLAVIYGGIATAQSDDLAENKRILEERNFVFIAENVSPQRGPMRPLNSSYDLVVNPDSIIAYLPYFGRAYTAPVNPSEGGIKFTSVDFNYKSEKKKKKGYDIEIKPNDVSGIMAIRLTAFENGRATLQVTLLNKEPISFTGYFVAGRERPKKPF